MDTIIDGQPVKIPKQIRPDILFVAWHQQEGGSESRRPKWDGYTSDKSLDETLKLATQEGADSTTIVMRIPGDVRLEAMKRVSDALFEITVKARNILDAKPDSRIDKIEQLDGLFNEYYAAKAALNELDKQSGVTLIGDDDE